MQQQRNVASNDYTQFEPIFNITPLDDWYDAKAIDNIEPHTSVKDEELLNFKYWESGMFNSKS